MLNQSGGGRKGARLAKEKGGGRWNFGNSKSPRFSASTAADYPRLKIEAYKAAPASPM